MTLYLKHIIQDCQQEKAKRDTLQNLGDKDIFWIKDWLLKILPRKFREPQQDYFGKKGMSQHVVIYMKKDNNLHKYVYFTLLQKCDQNMAQTLSVMGHVCKQIKADFPNIIYWRACHILKQNGFSLIKHDFNEPQKGKDQCDRESTVVQHCKTVYINAGNNIQTVEDINNEWAWMELNIYMNGVKNAKVYIADIDSSVNEIKSQKIENIFNYHSAEFEDNKICFWNYYSVGKSIVAEKKCVEFTSGLNVLSRFEKVGSNYNSTPCEHKKPRLDCMRNDNISYCPISDCVKTFLNEAALEIHMLLNSRSHSLTGLDQVSKPCNQ